MSDEERKRSKSRVLRFAVTSALLIGPAAVGCDREPDHVDTPPPEPAIGNAPAPEEPVADEPQLLGDPNEGRSTNVPMRVDPPVEQAPPTEGEPPPPEPTEVSPTRAHPPTRRTNAPANVDPVDDLGDL